MKRPAHLKKVAAALQKAVDVMLQSSDYSDALYMDIHSRMLRKDKTAVLADCDSDHGVKLRIQIGGILHEACASSTDGASILKLARKLAKKADYARAKNEEAKREEKKETTKKRVGKQTMQAKRAKYLDEHFASRPKIDVDKVSLKRKIKLCETYFKKVQASDKDIINTRVALVESREEKVFVGPNKCLSQIITGCRMLVMPFVKAHDGSIRYHYESYFRPGLEVEKVMAANLNHAIMMTQKIRDAKKIKPGKYLVISSPHVTGLLAHESFGHGMEADTMYKDRARAREYLGKKIAPRYVDIIDNPAFPDRNGSFFFDDEGQLSAPTPLIEKGIVKRPITDARHAALLGIPRSANGRCESFDHKSYARMSNTYFGAGKSSAKAMVKSIKNGLFLHYSTGGMEDPKGWGVQIQGIVAERIKNGKLTGEVFYEVGLSGFLPTILSNIKQVSREFMLEGTGMCGKGHKEWVRVSEGGPFLKIKDLPLS